MSQGEAVVDLTLDTEDLEQPKPRQAIKQPLVAYQPLRIPQPPPPHAAVIARRPPMSSPAIPYTSPYTNSQFGILFIVFIVFDLLRVVTFCQSSPSSHQF
jgi:hypothetical protein